MNNLQLESYLNQFLNAAKIKDYCPNGLQVQGKATVNKVVTGVTASMALIEAAIAAEADALLVHHGYFWKGEAAVITGLKYKRFKALLGHDINLYAYHLPLDIHPVVGNNVQLANLLGIKLTDGLTAGDPLSVGNIGQLVKPTNINDFNQYIEQVLNRKTLLEKAGKTNIETVALCTGGAQDFIERAADRQADLYITGEVSERTILMARELEINFIAAGHHATERYGAKALGEHLAKEFEVEVEFIDIDNPA